MRPVNLLFVILVFGLSTSVFANPLLCATGAVTMMASQVAAYTESAIKRCNDRCCFPGDPTLTCLDDGYGMRTHPMLGGRRMHTGVDINYNWERYNRRRSAIQRVEGRLREPNTNIHAAFSGRVLEVNNSDPDHPYGLYVILTHRARNNDGEMVEIRTRYAHMREGCGSLRRLREGMEVERGNVIGCMGRTGQADGDHLHFEVLDATGTPVDPNIYCPLEQVEPEHCN